LFIGITKIFTFVVPIKSQEGSMEILEQSLGAPITPTALARWLGVSVQTIRKHADRWGGVEVTPKKLIFFERIVEERIKSHAATVMPAPVPQIKVATPTMSLKRVEDPHGLLSKAKGR
jgi:hypothetical protein